MRREPKSGSRRFFICLKLVTIELMKLLEKKARI